MSSGVSIITQSDRIVLCGIRPRRSLLVAPTAVRDSGRASPSLRHEEPGQTTSNQWQNSTYEVSTLWGQVGGMTGENNIFRSIRKYE